MGLLDQLGPRGVDRLRSLESSLGFLDRLIEGLPPRRVHSEPFVNALFHETAKMVGQVNLTSVFTEITDEAARTLLAQVVIAFFVWEPLSLLAPDRGFEHRASEHLAIMRRAEDRAVATRRSPFHILKETHPPHVVEQVLFYSVQHIMRRPLGFLYATGKDDVLAPTVLDPLVINALIMERNATSRHAQGGRPSPRQMLLRCATTEPTLAVSQKAVAFGIDILHFTPDEVFASFAPGERVLEHIRTKWNWRQLEDLAPQKAN